jgi:hypothetical protein
LSVLSVAYATHSTLKPVPTVLRERQIAVTVWQIPDAVDTVKCAPDGGWKYHPKHVEKFPDINKVCNIKNCWIYIWILLGTHPILHISKIKFKELSHEMGKKYGYHTQNPTRTEGLYTIEWGLVPQEDRLRYCYYYVSVIQPLARYLPPWLG